MKKILCVLCIISIIFTLGACKKNELQTNGNVKVKTPPVSPNWQKLVEKNEIKIGVPSLNPCVSNELIDAFSTEIDIPIKKVLVNSTSEFKDVLDSNDIDMYWGVYPKEAKNSINYTFSNPYITTSAVTVALKSSEEDFADKNMTFGVVKGSTEEILAKDKYISVNTYNSLGEVLTALGNGTVNFAMLNNSLFETSPYSKNESFKIADSMMYNLVIAFKDGNSDVATEVDKIFAKIKASGKAGEICTKWYGKDLIAK